MKQGTGPSRLQVTVAAVVVSVLLFACGAEPQNPQVASAGQAAPGGIPSAASVGTAPAPAPPAPGPGTLAAPAPAGAPGWESQPAAQPTPATFGSEGQPEQAEAAEETHEAEEDADYVPVRPLRDDPSGPRVWSNKDLKRFGDQLGVGLAPAGAASAAGTGAGGASGTDERSPGETETSKDSASALSPAEWEKQYETTFDAIAKLNEELESLRKRIPSLHNPLLPRVGASETDKVAETGMNNAEKLEHVNARIAATERELDEMKRRFAEIQDSRPAESSTAPRQN